MSRYACRCQECGTRKAVSAARKDWITRCHHCLRAFRLIDRQSRRREWQTVRRRLSVRRGARV